jgi:regulator of ribosome biosynthesis
VDYRGAGQCWYALLFSLFSSVNATPSFIDVDHDPRKVARDARKERIAKNEKKHVQNVARATGSTGAAPSNMHPREARKNDIEKTLATTRISTASMGKFDKKLEGEKKLRGMKRKVCCFISSLQWIF